MNLIILKNHRKLLIIGLIGFFVLVALWLRLIPMLTMGHTDILSMVASDDPQYDLRLVELSLANHFQYAWFDPMSNFPHRDFDLLGSDNHLYCGSRVHDRRCGHPSGYHRGMSSCDPPFRSRNSSSHVFCRKGIRGLEDRTSGFRVHAVISGTFFLYSLYGYFNHRDGEVLFSTLFCLAYLYILISEKGQR